MSGSSEGARSGSTRGFLFADLRGYSQFVEQRGALAASELLATYRSIARAAIARFEGAEVQTEGDSFFVVFSSVSAAVRCGMALVADAGAQSTPDLPIRVGVGIHAGETVETSDSFIGSGVNIAARICSQARPGEVLVSETVRALTRNVLPVGFEARGRPSLKGIVERLPLYAVSESPASRGNVSRRGRVAVAGMVLLLGVAVLGIGWAMMQRAPGLPPGEWKIGLVTTLSVSEGDAPFLGGHIADAVELAVEELNSSGGIHGRPLRLVTLDDRFEEQLVRDHTRTLVNDAAVIAMIGPITSGHALRAVPISNAAGLLHCSPTNTDPALTKPRHGALDIRGSDEGRVSYVRIAPSDDIQSKAMARYAFVDLRATSVLVIDDGVIGGQMAEMFTQEFQALGGIVSTRTLNEGTDVVALLEPVLNGGQAPNAVFFSGETASGGPLVRLAMEEIGHADLPYLAWDAMLDGSGAEEGTYINAVGAELAEGTHATLSALPDSKFGFVSEYRDRFGVEPEQYAAGAYACVEVIVEALRAVAFPDMTASRLRDEVRGYTVDLDRRYETVVGNIGFDQNGDNVRQFVAFYRVDPLAEGGRGDWVLIKKQDFGPAP